MQYRKEHNDQTKINKTLVYTKYKMIENCSFDEDALNAFYCEPNVLETDNDDEAKVEYDGHFDAEIGSHGLPKGYEWKLKCPVLALKLQKRGDSKYYCGVCKKNVWVVENEKEMKEKVDAGECVQYTLSGKEKNIQRPRRFRGRVVRRSR